jgi:hypothetical protein
VRKVTLITGVLSFLIFGALFVLGSNPNIFQNHLTWITEINPKDGPKDFYFFNGITFLGSILIILLHRHDEVTLLKKTKQALFLVMATLISLSFVALGYLFIFSSLYKEIPSLIYICLISTLIIFLLVSTFWIYTLGELIFYKIQNE